MESNANSLFPVDFEFDFPFDFLLVDPDDKALSQWELVNSSDADDSDPSDYDHDRLDAVNLSGSLDEDSVDGNPNPPPSVDQYTIRDPDPTPISGIANRDFGGNVDAVGGDDGDEEEEIDDERVPRYLRGKLGRERIRKLGKRGCSKMNNTSKRSPFLYVKPGCLNGKHGFGIGLKNSL